MATDNSVFKAKHKFRYLGYGVQPHLHNPLDEITCYCGKPMSSHPDGYAVVWCRQVNGTHLRK